MKHSLPIKNAFTVDLEEWFQGLTSTNPLVEQWPTFESRVVYATEMLLDLLHTYQVRATFFVLGYVADQYPALIQQIHAAGGSPYAGATYIDRQRPGAPDGMVGRRLPG